MPSNTGADAFPDPAHVDAVLRAVADAEPRVGGVRVVTIDGPSGAGKSVLARAVADALGAPLVQTDELIPGWDGLADAAPLLTEQVLSPLSEGRPAAYRRWDWHADAWAEPVPVDIAAPCGGTEPGASEPTFEDASAEGVRTHDPTGPALPDALGVPVLIVEGCGCSVRPAGDFAAVRVWVDAPRDVRYARGIARDGETYAPHWTRWQRQEDALFAADRTRERADLVFVTG